MTDPTETQVLTYAAHRAQTRPEYLGWIFVQYRKSEQLTEAALAESLATTSSTVVRLSLCLRPRADHFAEDVQEICAKFNVAVDKLAAIVRFVESIEALRGNPQPASGDAGLLMAARSRPKPRMGKRKKHSDDDLPTT
jgi:hypothetical protein